VARGLGVLPALSAATTRARRHLTGLVFSLLTIGSPSFFPLRCRPAKEARPSKRLHPGVLGRFSWLSGSSSDRQVGDRARRPESVVPEGLQGDLCTEQSG